MTAPHSRPSSPATGSALAPPDDRLQRAIQYSVTSVMESQSCGVLDTPLSRSMTVVVERSDAQFRLCHSGMVRRTRPGISRFRVRCFASPRNDGYGFAGGACHRVACCAGPLARNDDEASALLTWPRSGKRRGAVGWAKRSVPTNYLRQKMVGTAQVRLCPPYENVAATFPSPASSITTLSPAVSQIVLTRLPVSTISPARRALPSEAR
jgi:hypothetical protein